MRINTRKMTDDEVSVTLQSVAQSMARAATARLRESLLSITGVDVEGRDWWRGGREVFETHVLVPVILDAMLNFEQSDRFMKRAQNEVRAYGRRYTFGD